MRLTYKILSLDETKQEILKKDDFLEKINPFTLKAFKIPLDKSLYPNICLKSCSAWVFEDNSVSDWIKEDINSFQEKWEKLNLPSLNINIALTSGKEMNSLFYTRGETIYFNFRVFDMSRKDFRYLLAHEIFHILTRNHPNIKKQAYAHFGFKKTQDIALKQSITNPDAPVNDYGIEVFAGTSKKFLVPFITTLALPFFNSIFFRLHDPKTKKNYNPIFTSLPWKIGFTTLYMAHAEEISADFFALVLTEKRPNKRVQAFSLNLTQK